LKEAREVAVVTLLTFDLIKLTLTLFDPVIQ